MSTLLRPPPAILASSEPAAMYLPLGEISQQRLGGPRVATLSSKGNWWHDHDLIITENVMYKFDISCYIYLILYNILPKRKPPSHSAALRWAMTCTPRRSASLHVAPGRPGNRSIDSVGPSMHPTRCADGKGMDRCRVDNGSVS